MKILIIGNSAAGTAAIEAIRKYDQESSIIQITDEIHPLYSRCLISYYLAGILTKQKLLYRETDFHKQMNVDLKSGKSVTRVDPVKQQLQCNDDTIFNYDKLLIATGSSAKIPANIPPDLDGVFPLRTLDDVESIKKRLKEAKKAVILGGGLIGMRAADALSKCGLKVTVVIRSNHILSQMIDDQAAQLITKKVLENKIEIMTGRDICNIEQKDNQLTAVETDQGQKLKCDLLIVAKGVNANIDLIRDTDINRNWGINTNSYLQTNYKNIFAAGDVAETYDITTEEYTINALWTCAVQQGYIAGLNMIGKEKVYDGSLGMNSLNFFNSPLISFGITAPNDPSLYNILIDNRPQQNIYKKIVIKDNCIKGIILVGKIANAGLLLSLIQKKKDVSAYAHELLSDQFNFAKLINYEGNKVLENY